MADRDKYAADQLSNFGDRLKQLRKEKGFSSAEKFAFHHDINRVQYGRYETGESDIRLTTLCKLLKAMDISLEEFFGEGFEK